MQTLAELFHEHQGKASDKWSSYLSTYHRLLSPWREQPISLLEIGVQNGGSLEVWARYFPNAVRIVGVDVDRKCAALRYADPRISVVVGDVNAAATERMILSTARQFDLIVDDGSHQSGDVIRSFARYFPHVADDGLYAVEDLHCSYWTGFDGGLYEPCSAMNFLKQLADVVNHEHWGLGRPASDVLAPCCLRHGAKLDEADLRSIHAVEFVNSLCVVRRRPPADNALGARCVAGAEALVASEVVALDARLLVVPPQQSAQGASARGEESRGDEGEGEAARDGLRNALRAREAHVDALHRALALRDDRIARLNAALAAHKARAGAERRRARGSPGLRSELGRGGFLAAHAPLKGLPRFRFARQPAVRSPGRVLVARRLLAAWRSAEAFAPAAAERRPGDDLETALQQREMDTLLAILAAGSAEELAEYLLHFGETATGLGAVAFGTEPDDPAQDGAHVAFTCFDKLICLAEALGVLPLENPARGRWAENLYADLDAVVEGIERAFGAPIAPPVGVLPVVGVRTAKGVFHARHLTSLWTAARLRAIAPEGGAVAEYGGGLGVVALYARRLGFSDYTLFDHPVANLLAGHFLINALGGEALSLHGEPAQPGTVKLLPYGTEREAAERAFRISLSVDGFAEGDEAAVRRCLEEIARNTRGDFLSIHHEARSTLPGARRQLLLSEVMADLPSFFRRHRAKFWLREGYVEELFAVPSSSQGTNERP